MGIFGGNQAGQARYSGELHNLQLTQSVFGTTAPIVFGTRRLPVKLLFYGGFYATPAPGQGKGLGGGKGNQQFNYYADIVGALASGCATGGISGGCKGILSVWDQQGKLANVTGSYVYTVPSGGGTVTPLSAPGSPPIQLDLGVGKSVAYSVVANDYGSGGSRTLTGNQSVAMTPVSGAPAAGQYQFNAGASSYTFAAADAGAQVTISYSTVFSLYYFQTTQPAQVPLLSPYQVSTNNQAYFWQDLGCVRVDTGATIVYGAGTNGYTVSAGVYTFTSDLAGVYVYINYSFTSNNSAVTNSSQLNLSFLGGRLQQPPWGYMTSKYPGAAFGYSGLCYVGANPMALGESATLPCYNYELVGLSVFPGGALDAHPCDAFRLLLYDAFLGVGFPAANVDAWTSCYAYWAANGYLISQSLDTQTSVADAFKEIIETGNVGAVWSGGLLKLIPYGDATCVGNGYTFTPNLTPYAPLGWNDLLAPTEEEAGQTSQDDLIQVEQRAPQDCWNYVQAQWCNRLNDYNNELINEQNDAFINDYGRRIESPQTWDFITSAAAAAWALNLRLKRQCYIRNTYKFWLSWRFGYLEPMDLVTLPTGENVRITQISDDESGRLAIEAEQWTYGNSNVTVYPKQSPTSFQPAFSTGQPGDAVPIVVQNPSNLTPGSPYTIQVAAAGTNPNWGGANLFMSLDGQTYTQIGQIQTPTVMGMLSAALPSGSDPDTTDTLSVDLTLSGSQASLATVTQTLADAFTTLCAIVDQAANTSELVSYETATLTASGRYNLSYLRRGAYGTIPAAHAAGAWFAFLGSNYAFETYTFKNALAGTPFYLKLQSFNLAGKQMQNLATCPVWQFLVGYQAGLQNLVYYPNAVKNVVTQFGGTITNGGSPFTGKFGSPAVFDSHFNALLLSKASANYANFPSVTLAAPATLNIAYQNLKGNNSTPGAIHYLADATISVSLTGTGPFTSLADSGRLLTSGASNNTPNGTLAVNIPAGTNLSNVIVSVGVSSQQVGSSGGSGTGQVAGHVEIVQIWITAPGSQLNSATLAVPVAFSSSVVFDLSQGKTQTMTLTGDVASCSCVNATADLYTFVILQDSAGGHAFAWPSNFRGGGIIAPTAGTSAPNTAASQTFAYNLALNQFIAVSPLTYGV